MQHGKDELARIWREQFGWDSEGSSQVCCDIFIFDALKDKYGYKNAKECYDDRVNHRPEWYELIADYNKDDPARLAKEIVSRTGRYIGMRRPEEIQECIRIGLFDLIIWIDASERKPSEPSTSFSIDKSLADIIIDNNGSISELEQRAERFGRAVIFA
jgi:hypothetical protein